jgi:putative hydrolase of the HAD superfamily
MSTIKAIAFDLGGVLMEENDYPLSAIEETLEQQFGKINTNDEYYAWAQKATNLSEEEIKNMVKNIIANIYDIREYDIFDRLPKIKLAIASNHLSAINQRIDTMELREKFDCIIISADSDVEKPNKEFYEKLITELKEKPEDILFVDDSKENIEAAKEMGLSVLQYDRSKSLTQEVLNNLK